MNTFIYRLITTGDSIIPLILRLTLGIVFLPHGLQKTVGLFGGHGFSGTMQFFTGPMHIPPVFAFLAIAAESAGALALILGLFTRVAAFGIGVVLVVAVATVHSANGFFMNWSGEQKGEGFEYHLLGLGIVIVLLITGGGKASVDRVIARQLNPPETR
jgi:putative oxidoreductase